ncbi:Gfo/Idh/MocA family oxidoreductase [Frankia sp. CNm7]|uniref:Gfo/Idh/MocA family oxidoreductase n=1 Tax=Frankia nepalensis TaxID=1836974 RepID=A0A937R996_9ACTN|nr:Gfo/Idh/MocA family oxidoreductase [Frankia nepalensis]MBL7496990.1 Gfo/Idh/MocA family oxidoreductase [Frankia nepalensis]MBL7511309.1 Gfo/Idh/MocA family oxidoreductase [Frankia nepalensis]MBL7523597.1 Gfo/Idh/MocA family oxidoreductase [Frankia nepalensis]MBL7626077.1 Gfo/Idh/MocA family oxidoreductase [Frankia nepalensis]
MVRWGVVGPGEVAAGFAQAMESVADGEIVAVASRCIERAVAFGDRFGVARRYGDYAALGADPDVDVVYVATPASRHERDTLAVLEAGKHVLCEKPFAMDAAGARRMAERARARGLFLMEAMWSRFLPSYRALVDVLGSGRIGEPLLVEADFGMRWPIQPEHRLFDPRLGGGALLDLGVYPVQLCSLVLGPPERVVADGVVGATGVDEQVAAVLRHRDGALGVVKTAIRTTLACTARIAGTDGSIDLPAFMHCPDAITVTTRPGGAARIDASYEGNGLRFEIAEVHRCLAEGLTESPVMTLDETLSIAATLDAIRAQVLAGDARTAQPTPL